jgi:hypothetical protein
VGIHLKHLQRTQPGFIVYEQEEVNWGCFVDENGKLIKPIQITWYTNRGKYSLKTSKGK